MARCLLNLLAATSLALCLCTIILWVRSYVVIEQVDLFSADEGNCFVFTYCGRLTSVHGRIGYSESVFPHENGYWKLENEGFEPEEWPSVKPRLAAAMMQFDDARFDRFGFVIGATIFQGVFIPYWCIVGLSAPLPLLRLASFVRRRARARRGHCPTCNYDLRHSPDRCPECGTTRITTCVNSSSPTSHSPSPKTPLSVSHTA